MKYDFSKISNIPEVSNAFSQNINQNFSYILEKHNLSKNSKVNYLWENYILNLSFIITDTSFSVFNEKRNVVTYSFTNIFKIDFDAEYKEFAIYYSEDYVYGKISGDFFGIDNTISSYRYSEIATEIKDFLNPIFLCFESKKPQATSTKTEQNILKLDNIEILDKEEIVNFANMEVKDIIINEINNNINLSNDPEIVFFNQNGVLLNIPKDKLFKIREINGLDRNAEILYARFYQFYKPGDFWDAARTVIYSTIFLKDKISIRQIIETTGWDKKPDYIIDIYWEEIEEVEAIYFEDKDENGKDIREYAIQCRLVKEEVITSCNSFYNEVLVCDFSQNFY